MWFWFVTLGLVALLMVVALIQFTLALIASPRAPDRKPASLNRLRTALLALNGPHRTFQIEQLSESEMRVGWIGLNAAQRAAAMRIHNPFSYNARLLLFEPSAEVRCFESVRTKGKVGGGGANVEMQWGAVQAVYAGLADYVTSDGSRHQVHVQLDTTEIKDLIETAARQNGWALRSVVLPFQATAAGALLSQRLTPDAVRRLGPRRFWGVVYVATWIAIIALLLARIPQSLATIGGLIAVVCTFALVQWLVVRIWRQSPRHASEVE